MKRKPYMLATDLDGTLVGDKGALQRLLRNFANSNDDIALVYITGRHFSSSLSLIQEERLPMPDILITDVGTRIYTTESLVEDEIWTEKMQTDWQPDLIEELAYSIPSLSRQKLPINCRISFTTRSGNDTVTQLEKVLIDYAIPCKLIFSSNRDVDILPKNSGKGQALTYVLDQYACPNVQVLIAGDSGNDLEMLTLGYPSVIVGNAQPELTSAKSHPQLYRATKSYADGIQEGWRHFYET